MKGMGLEITELCTVNFDLYNILEMCAKWNVISVIIIMLKVHFMFYLTCHMQDVVLILDVAQDLDHTYILYDSCDIFDVVLHNI